MTAQTMILDSAISQAQACLGPDVRMPLSPVDQKLLQVEGSASCSSAGRSLTALSWRVFWVFPGRELDLDDAQPLADVSSNSGSAASTSTDTNGGGSTATSAAMAVPAMRFPLMLVVAIAAGAMTGV